MKEGWQIKKLGDVLEKTETVNPLLSPEKEFEYIDVSSVSNSSFQVETTQRLKGIIAPSRARKLVHTDDIIFATIRPTLQRIAMVPEHLDRQVCSTGYFVLRPKSGIDHRFVFYYLFTEDFMGQMEALQKGASYPAVTDGQVKAQEIPVPPLPEQQRIVAKLDEAFKGIATAKANAERNLKNARAIFESELNAIFTKKGEGWEEKRLGDVVTRLTNGYVGPTRDIYQDYGVPYLLARHVKDNRLLFDGKTFITEEFNRKNKKSMLKAGDVLLVQSGHIGHSAVVTPEHEGHNCHAMIVITPVEGAFIGPFISLFFNSPDMKQKFQEIRSGSTVPHLTCGEVRELIVPLPDLATQLRLVDHSIKLESKTERLESIYQRKLSELEALKKSLLHHAFTGHL